MKMKELAAAAEVIRGFCNCPEVIGVYGGIGSDFPTIQLTEKEFLEHFGNVLPEPFTNNNLARKVKWSGAEFIALVPIEE